MLSFLVMLRLVLTSFLITSFVAAKPIDFFLPFTDRQNAASCASDSDCSVNGCTCILPNVEVCANLALISDELAKCTKCTSDADCPGDSRGCATDLAVCQTCASEGILIGAQACLPQPSSGSSSSEEGNGSIAVRRCSATSSCITSCKCIGEGDERFCVNQGILNSIWGSCKECVNSSDCPDDSKGCDDITNLCATCSTRGIVESTDACKSGDGGSPSTQPTPTATAAVTQTPPTPVANTPTPSPSERRPILVPCISTAWLQNQGMEHAVLRNAGISTVFCIPGLPCGTAGHLLRQCKKGMRYCTLVSYREVCGRRSDCVISAEAVSQLSHTFEWSSFRVVSESITLELTSVSAHPLSSSCSPSRLFGYAGDFLNRIGLGSFCNFIALSHSELNLSFKSLMFSVSG